MADMSSIMGKIKKCLALAESSNVHEAAAALRQAQKLMEIHQIDQTTLTNSAFTTEDLRSTTAVSAPKHQELKLIKNIAAAFGCELIWTKGNSYGKGAAEIFGRYTFIGLATQVPVAVYTAQVLLKRLQKARAEFIKTETRIYTRDFKTRAADSFCLGWVHEVTKTVIAFAAPTGMAESLEAYKVQLYPHLKQGRAVKQTQVYGEFMDRGKAAASGESLFRPMETKKSILKLGN